MDDFFTISRRTRGLLVFRTFSLRISRTLDPFSSQKNLATHLPRQKIGSQESLDLFPSEKRYRIKIRSFLCGCYLCLVVLSTLDRVDVITLSKPLNYFLREFCLRQNWGLFVQPNPRVYWTVPVKNYRDGNRINLYTNKAVGDWAKAELITWYGDNHRWHKFYQRIRRKKYRRFLPAYLQFLCSRERGYGDSKDFDIELYRITNFEHSSRKKAKIIAQMPCLTPPK